MPRRPALLCVLLLAPLAWACGGGGAPEPQQSVDNPAAAAPFLLVVNKSGNTLSVVDPSTRATLRTIPTGFAPHEVALSPDGALAFVTDYGNAELPGSTVTVVDTRSWQVIRTLSLLPHTRPHGVAVARDGTVWVTAEGSGHVLHLDAETGEILQAVATGQQTTHMVAVAEEMGRVVTANIGSGTATIVDAATGVVLVQVETGAGSEGLTVGPDGSRAYLTAREAGTLAEVDLATGQVLRTLEVGNFPIRARLRGNGRELLVSNYQGNEIVAVDLEGWTVVRRLAVGAAPVGILVTPDDRMAFVANTGDDKLTVVDLDTWQIVGEVPAGDEPDGMAWVR